jgi:hypothetical protein
VTERVFTAADLTAAVRRAGTRTRLAVIEETLELFVAAGYVQRVRSGYYATAEGLAIAELLGDFGISRRREISLRKEISTRLKREAA